MTMPSSGSSFLETLQGEVSFFRSLMRARPVGIHRHFHVLAIRNAIEKDTGHLVSVDDIWDKIKSCWDLDALDGLETDGYDSPGSNHSTPVSISSPSPTDNLYNHPFFRDEFSLPSDESFESLMTARRIRTTASPVTSPTPPPTSPSRAKAKAQSKRGKSKMDMAGLVGGDSDSSALTQESGDEGVPPTPRSTVTGTDAGTDYAEDEGSDMHDDSPAPSSSSKPTRNKGKTIKRGGVVGRTRATAGSSTKPSKKRKR